MRVFRLNLIITIAIVLFLFLSLRLRVRSAAITRSTTGHDNDISIDVIGSDISILGVINVNVTDRPDLENITLVIPYGADQIDITHLLSVIAAPDNVTQSNNETRITYWLATYVVRGAKSIGYHFKIKNVVQTSPFGVLSLNLKTPYVKELDKVSVQLYIYIKSFDAVILSSSVPYKRELDFLFFAWGKGKVVFSEWYVDLPHGVKEISIVWTYNPVFSYLVGLPYTWISVGMFSLGQFIQLFMYCMVKFLIKRREWSKPLKSFTLPILIYLLIAPVTFWAPYEILSLNGIGQYYHIPLTICVAKMLRKRLKTDIAGLSTASSILSGTTLILFVSIMPRT